MATSPTLGDALEQTQTATVDGLDSARPRDLRVIPQDPGRRARPPAGVPSRRVPLMALQTRSGRSATRRRSIPGTGGRSAAIFLIPFFTLFALTMIAPVVYAIGLSLFAEKRSGLGFGDATIEFVGVGNYLDVLSNRTFVEGFGRLAIYCVLYVPTLLITALVLALLLDAVVTYARRAFQLLLFLPHAVPGVKLSRRAQAFGAPWAGVTGNVGRSLSGARRRRNPDWPHHQRRARAHMARATDASGVRPASGSGLAGTLQRLRVVGIHRERRQRRAVGNAPGTEAAADRGRPPTRRGTRCPPRRIDGGRGHRPEGARYDALTIGFARRFATYKRATMATRDLDALAALVNDPQRPVQFVFAGKAHPHDGPGKEILQEIARLTRDPRFAGKIVFVEDYDINVGRHLVQGVDLWINNPRRPLEACGTSGQKVVLNGGLNLSILDGWWAEAYDGRNGFAIGAGETHSSVEVHDARDARALLDTLRNEVVPLFYDRDGDGLPREWIARMKRAIRTLGWRFSADRMVLDYVRECYIPAAGGRSCDVKS